MARIGSLARSDVATAHHDDLVGAITGRGDPAGYGTTVVVNRDGVVLGTLGQAELSAAGPGSRAADVMAPGPSTYRPDVPVAELLERLQRKRLGSALVTTPEGRLIGLFLAEDAPAG